MKTKNLTPSVVPNSPTPASVISCGFTLGLDLGDRSHYVCVLDASGQIVREASLPNTRPALSQLLTDFPRATVALEAGTHSPWISRYLTELGATVFVATPRKLHAISRNERKCDRRDAQMLARLARADVALLHPIKHGTAQAQHDLLGLKLRDALVRTRVNLINTVRFTLKSLGHSVGNPSSESFHKTVLADIPADCLPVVQPLLTVMTQVTEQIKGMERDLVQRSKKDYPVTQRLQQISGVGPLTALCFVLKIGDPERFSRGRDVGAYLGNNILDSQSGIRHPFRKPKIRKTPVTLIVGIICKDGIVLAADSQTTKGISIGASKSCDTNKINVVEFSNGKALVAESGSASLSNTAIETFQRMAKNVKIENEATICKLAESAIREVRSRITNLHPSNTTPEGWQDFFTRDVNYFELMLAYYFDGIPYLYVLNPLWCIPVKATSYFETSGIASELANYILKEHTEPKMDSEFAAVIAIKVVEDAIEYVEGRGKPTKVALIQPPVKIPELPPRQSSNPLEETAGYSLSSLSYRSEEHTSELQSL